MTRQQGRLIPPITDAWIPYSACFVLVAAATLVGPRSDDVVSPRSKSSSSSSSSPLSVRMRLPVTVQLGAGFTFGRVGRFPGDRRIESGHLLVSSSSSSSSTPTATRASHSDDSDSDDRGNVSVGASPVPNAITGEGGHRILAGLTPFLLIPRPDQIACTER